MRAPPIPSPDQKAEFSNVDRVVPALHLRKDHPCDGSIVPLASHVSSSHRARRGRGRCRHDMPIDFCHAFCPSSAGLRAFVPAYGPRPQIGTEEVTVPLVLSRVFHQILPSLAPVLAQRGGASATATGFRYISQNRNPAQLCLLPAGSRNTVAIFVGSGACVARSLSCSRAERPPTTVPVSPLGFQRGQTCAASLLKVRAGGEVSSPPAVADAVPRDDLALLRRHAAPGTSALGGGGGCFSRGEHCLQRAVAVFSDAAAAARCRPGRAVFG